MHYAYNILLYFLLPFALLRLCWRALKAPLRVQRWRERLGWVMPLAQPVGIWIHAVSLGETIAAVPLIKSIQHAYPTEVIMVTNMTLTGANFAQTAFGDSVIHAYLPYDLPGAVRRFLHRTRPRLAILMETELWPNLLHYCKRQGVLMIVANARLSERSARKYAYFPKFVQRLLQNITVLAAQTPDDARRFIHLGMPEKNIMVTGNLKFDIEIPAHIQEQAKILRQQLGMDRSVWIAASTHEGEEEQILHVFSVVQQRLPNALLILVPRHPERFSKVAALCRKQGFSVALRSQTATENLSPDTVIFLGDTMGELLLFYATSDVAFVGGSLIVRGGHNVLEPAALGLPILTGPYMFNFTEITRLLQDANALISVNNASELAEQVICLLQDSDLRSRLGSQGQAVVAQNRGALLKHMALIKDIFD